MGCELIFVLRFTLISAILAENIKLYLKKVSDNFQLVSAIFVSFSYFNFK